MDRRALGHFHYVLEDLLLAIDRARSWPGTTCMLTWTTPRVQEWWRSGDGCLAPKDGRVVLVCFFPLAVRTIWGGMTGGFGMGRAGSGRQG